MCPVHISESVKENQMKLETVIREVQSARSVTLLQVITELLPVLIFAIISLSVAYLLKYKRESKETWYIDRGLSEKVWLQEP